MGRRILRQVTDNVNPQKSNIKKYDYDGANILAELDAGNNLTASYTHSPLRPDDILGAKFTSYATPVGAISEGQVLTSGAGAVYYLKDHLNTVYEITYAAGDIVQKMDYSVFGVLRSVKDASGNEVDFAAAPVRTSFTYTGREFEPELNMYYYRARYYDPSVGRFLQQDPEPGKLGDPSTFLSKYVYTANNPVMFSDPSGKNFGFIFAAIFTLPSLILMNTTTFFQDNFGFTKEDIKTVNTIALAAIIIAAAYMTGGAAAGAANGSFAGAFAGGIVGAGTGMILGMIGFPALGLGDSHEGAQFGFALGAVAGAIGGSASAITKAWGHQADLVNRDGWFDYFTNFKIDKSAWYIPDVSRFFVNQTFDAII